MIRSIHLVAAAAIGLALSSSAAAQPVRGIGQRGDPLFGQREQTPPDWSIGTWTGKNEFRRTAVSLKIGSDGRATMAISLIDNAQSQNGQWRNGRLEFGSERYTLRRQSDDTFLMTKESDRRDTVLMRRVGIVPGPGPVVGGPLTITQPRDGDRVGSGIVRIEGTTSDPEVQIEVSRVGQRITRITVPTRGGRFSTQLNLDRGRYDLSVRTRGRGRQSTERRISFEVGGGGVISIERPADRSRFSVGSVEIAGIADTRDVEIEVMRGGDRVSIQQISTRDGRFSTRVNLPEGHYIVFARSKEGGRVLQIDRQSFDVGNGGGNIPNDPRNIDLRIDRPGNRARLSGNSIDFEGRSNASEVRLEIYRDRDRIYSETVQVRDGRFRTRVQMMSGHYDAVVTADVRGRNRTERRISFDVTAR